VSGAPGPIRLVALQGIPDVMPGDELAALLRAAAQRASISLTDGALVVAQKIVSKAEGRVVALCDVTPSAEAKRFAAEDGRDPRELELVLRESARIVRRGHGVTICETKQGFVCANAGVDRSNAPAPDTAVLLPLDPDASARALRDALRDDPDAALAVIISDTFGRPWREGLLDVAIGSAGIAPICDLRGRADRAGRALSATVTATADQLAAAAGLLMRKDAGVPAVWVEGIAIEGDGDLRATLRDPSTDLFR